MKLSALLLTLWLVTGVFGRYLAGGFERVWFWYAYQVDLTVYGQGKTFIAPGCIGTMKDKSCTFNEFIKWINNLENLPSITDDVKPDVATTARALDDAGLDGDYSISKIYPGGGVPGIPTLFMKVADVVVLSKQTLGSDLSSISDLLEKVDEASLGVSDLRNADQKSNLARFAAPKAIAQKFELKTKVESYYGEKFTVIDVRATVAAYPKIANINDMINRWKGDMIKTAQGNSHENILRKLKAARISQKGVCPKG